MSEILKSRNLMLTILLFQSLVWITIVFDIQIARQILGFFYLTFIPGLIILKLLKLERLALYETILLSAGISVAFSMLVGLLLNQFGPFVGIMAPLSSAPLVVVLSIFVTIGVVLASLRGQESKQEQSRKFRITKTVIVLTILPALSSVGALFVNAFGSNAVLLFNIAAISMLFAVAISSRKLLPPSLYPFVVAVIAAAIILHSALISSYIFPFGSDVQIEYYVFRTTQDSSLWPINNPFFSDSGYGRLNAMLSITILPTIYANVLNINSVWVFKLVFPLFLVLIPLALYSIWKTYFGEKYAFAAAFLLMAQSTFYTELLGLNRQIIAELFFVLLLFVFLKRELKSVAKLSCFIIFSIGLVVSHYGLAEIFLLLICLVVIFQALTKSPSRNITASMTVLFFVIMFSWYIYTSNAAVFDSFVSFGNYIYDQLGDFFNPASRGELVLRGLGAEAAPSILNALSRAFAYITQGLIVIGFVGLLVKRTKVRVERDYFALSFVALAFLILLVLVPGLANTMNMTRFYHVLLFFLAPLCSVGVLVVAGFVTSKREKLLATSLLLIVLVPYFLFQTGFVYEVTGSDSWSVPLSHYRMDPLRLYGHFGYIDSNNVYSAQWISNKINLKSSDLYADGPSKLNVLTTYGMIYRGIVREFSNITILTNSSVVYLSTLNVIYGKIMSGGGSWNSSEFEFLFDNLDKIYTNGGSEIYEYVP